MDREPASAKSFIRCPECLRALPHHTPQCSVYQEARRKLLKFGLIAGAGSVAAFLLGSQVFPKAQALPGGTNSIVTPGSMVTGFDYIINKPASQAFARNGRTGDNDTVTGTDEAVVQSTITNQSGGEEIFVMDNLALSSASIAIPANYTLSIVSDAEATITAPAGKPIFTFAVNSQLLLDNVRLVDSAIGLNDLIRSSVWVAYPSSAALEAVMRINSTTSPNLGRMLSINSAKNFGIEVVMTGNNSDGIAAYNQADGAAAFYGEISSVGGGSTKGTIARYEFHKSLPTLLGIDIADFVGGATALNVSGISKNVGTGLQVTNPQVASPTNPFTGALLIDNQQSGAAGDILLDTRMYQDIDSWILYDLQRSTVKTIQVGKDSNGGYASINNSSGVAKFKVIGSGKITVHDGISSTLGGGSVLQTLTKAGAPVDGDFTGPADGLVVVDTTNNKIWTRIGGTWKGVVVA